MRGAPDPPAEAEAVFGDRLSLARRYADLLATSAVTRGLIGPREAARLWARHLMNCAVVAELLPAGARVVDVGSGAGLPGLALAIRSPELRVDLVESLQRRVDFLGEAVASLGLAASVRVVHGRAENRDVIADVGDSAWVTARAVAPLDRLVRWCMPLLRPEGRLLALKGSSAPDEIATHQSTLGRLGVRDVEVARCGAGTLPEPTVVVVVRRAA